MDESHSESDVSLSPSQLLERLQVLRQLQLMQRGKLNKQRLQYQGSPEMSSSITEIVSHFSNSTSYNTFRSLLQSPHNDSYNESNEPTPRSEASCINPKVTRKDLVDGIAVLNISQESEFLISSPTLSTSRSSAVSKNDCVSNRSTESKILSKKICLDEMPILTPIKDFEALVLEKLQNEKEPPKSNNPKVNMTQNKKPFLKRGEGMNRFGLSKTSLVIQNTKSLPWKQKSNSVCKNSAKIIKPEIRKSKDKIQVKILVNEKINTKPKLDKQVMKGKSIEKQKDQAPIQSEVKTNHEMHSLKVPSPTVQRPKGKHPLINKGKTWAAVLSKEQNDFLRQLKQSDYYKNYSSPAKSTISNISSDETLTKLQLERELAEQNMFELLERKVTNESFNLNSPFFDQFLKRHNLECSGESTPQILQKCLTSNPKLMHIFPYLNRQRNDTSRSEPETCNTECTEQCDDEDCSSVSCCCSYKTIEETNNSFQSCIKDKQKVPTPEKSMASKRKEDVDTKNKKSSDVIVTENEILKANMADMNAKLVATSELLKDRLRELEDEIETFRKENAILTKMREDVDLERQKFYEEKALFEQKFNEEKILSEYYLAEEKEKLTTQKQMYEKYVREMRGRLNKKDKDEVVNLKKEISDLKEEIRLKDAKSTSTIARLRNHIKIMEKEKKDLQEEVEKLKKENRRIQHSNDMTRRLTNIKYLEQINKKLTNMSAKEARSEVDLSNDVKYKAFEIERQSRTRRVQPVAKNVPRPRAKSVPNINVTSRYAKYFSQRDAVSQMERNMTVNEQVHLLSDNEQSDYENNSTEDVAESVVESASEDENQLEKIYMERFHSISPNSNGRSNNSHSVHKNQSTNSNDFFIRKSNSVRHSNSPKDRSHSPNVDVNTIRSKSPVSILSNRSSNQNNSDVHKSANPLNTSGGSNNSINRSQSPVTVLSNCSSRNRLSPTVISKESSDRLTVSPETTSKTSLQKRNFNPTEIRKPDGSRELRFPNGNVKHISSDGKYSKFVYYNGDVKENFYKDGRVKYFYAETKTYHTTHADGLEVLEFPDGQVEKRYKDGSSEIRLPNGSVRYFDPKNEHVREEWRFPDGAALSIAANGEQKIVFSNGQIEVHAKDHKRREFPDGTVKLVYNDGTSETRYTSGRVRIKDKHGNLIMDSAPG